MRLVLRLEGHLQSWGSTSRLSKRETNAYPTLSGVAGLIGNAMGLKKSVDVSDVSMSVRIDRPGDLVRDFYTAGTVTGVAQASGGLYSDGVVGEKFFLSFASFLVVLDGPEGKLAEWAEALQAPKRTLFLGRRTCIPSRPVFEALTEVPTKEVLDFWPSTGNGVPQLVLESSRTDPMAQVVYDVPLSDRDFASRVVRTV